MWRFGKRSQHLGTFGLLFAALALWGLAAPMFGSPDEGAHMVRAWGIVRGDAAGSPGPDGSREVRVSPMLSASWAPCFAFGPQLTADCLVVPPDEGSVLVESRASEYPPGPHVLVGVPTLVLGGLKSLYAMRLTQGLACAGLLTLAIANLRSLPRPGIAMAGLAVALTPLLLFLSGTVNPSGLSATAGVAVWTGALALVDPRSARSVAWSAAAFGAPLCALLITRRDGLLWAGTILVAALVLVSGDRLRELLRSRAVLGWAVASVAVAAMQYALWTSSDAASFTGGAEAAGGGSAPEAFGRFFTYVYQSIGYLGWYDALVPLAVFVVWLALCLGLILVALASAPARITACLLVTMVLLVGTTTILGAIRFSQSETVSASYFQGRYFLPLAVGVPILAAYGIGEVVTTRLPARAVAVWFGLVLVLHQISFFQYLRKNVVGSEGRLTIYSGGAWQPPTGPVWLFLVAYPAVLGALFWAVASAGRVEPSKTEGPAGGAGWRDQSPR